MFQKKLPLISILALTLGACASKNDPTPVENPPVASNAEEAWPDAPSNVPVISSADILAACNVAGTCSEEVMQKDPATRLHLVDLCVFDAVFSAERSIPLSGFGHANERAEYWTRCVLDHANDCSAVNACKTERDSAIACEEDGCRATKEFIVSCDGSVATLTSTDPDAPGSFKRDCAHAFAQCEPASPTGCSDRHASACSADLGSADRCDGNVRLGCDATTRVSYHDCTRLGGTCGLAGNIQDCVYAASEPSCDANLKSAACNGDKLTACVNGREFSLSSALCQ